MLSIEFDIDDIYGHVTQLTGLVGRGRGEYDRFVCSPDNYPALDFYLKSSITTLHFNCSVLLSSIKIDDDESLVRVYVRNDSLTDDQLEMLKTNIIMALSYSIASVWLFAIDSDASSALGSEFPSYATAANRIMAMHPAVNDAQYQKASIDNENITCESLLDGRKSVDDNIHITKDSLLNGEKLHADDDNIQYRSSLSESQPQIIDDIVEKLPCKHGCYEKEFMPPRY